MQHRQHTRRRGQPHQVRQHLDPVIHHLLRRRDPPVPGPLHGVAPPRIVERRQIHPRRQIQQPHLRGLVDHRRQPPVRRRRRRREQSPHGESEDQEQQRGYGRPHPIRRRAHPQQPVQNADHTDQPHRGRHTRRHLEDQHREGGPPAGPPPEQPGLPQQRGQPPDHLQERGVGRLLGAGQPIGQVQLPVVLRGQHPVRGVRVDGRPSIRIDGRPGVPVGGRRGVIGLGGGIRHRGPPLGSRASADPGGCPLFLRRTDRHRPLVSSPAALIHVHEPGSCGLDRSRPRFRQTPPRASGHDHPDTRRRPSTTTRSTAHPTRPRRTRDEGQSPPVSRAVRRAACVSQRHSCSTHARPASPIAFARTGSARSSATRVAMAGTSEPPTT
jgi:hypothetical protein